MPSYRYLRDASPESLQPTPAPEYTKKEKASNWLHYHWGWVAGGLAFILLLVWGVTSFTGRIEPDVSIGIVSPDSFPDELRALLEEQLSALVPDLNGDGRQVVQLEIFTLRFGTSASISGGVEDPNVQMANFTRFAGALQTASPMIFLATETELPALQADTALFGRLSGQPALPGDDVQDNTLAWQALPLLASLELPFTTLLLEGTQDGQTYLQDFRLGIRAFSGSPLEAKKNGAETWDGLYAFFRLLAGL